MFTPDITEESDIKDILRYSDVDWALLSFFSSLRYR